MYLSTTLLVNIFNIIKMSLNVLIFFILFLFYIDFVNSFRGNGSYNDLCEAYKSKLKENIDEQGRKTL